MPNPLDSVKHWYDLTYSSYKTVLHASSISGKGVQGFPEDSVLISFTNTELHQEMNKSNQDLDEMAVVLFWAVFEQNVLDHIGGLLSDIKETPTDFERIIIDFAKNQAERGRFREILDLFKPNIVSAEVVGDVKQIYNFRNWVAHGKRKARPTSVDPITAYQRLTDFLMQANII